jgi:hypothetical protein
MAYVGFYLSVKVKAKANFKIEHAMKAQRGSRCMTLLLL